MEHINYQSTNLINPIVLNKVEQQTISTESNFIQANTIQCSLSEIRDKHIIPVFSATNECLISHAELIESTSDIVSDIFHGERILNPNIRVSHPVMGRTPDAIHKPVNQLEDWEKTIYYERQMFIIEIPSIQEDIGGNRLSLTIGAVKSYGLDNLYGRTQGEQHFKVFIGFQNKVCCNLCVWSDGYIGDLKVRTLEQLQVGIRNLIQGYNQYNHIEILRQLTDYSITEQQFANIIGRCRMYQHLPNQMKSNIPALLFGDNQIGTVAKDYYKDKSFSRDKYGNINLWKLYNLFTGSNKSSYIDSFLDRAVNATSLVGQIKDGVVNKADCWYLN
jgi:hypothetical protein